MATRPQGFALVLVYFIKHSVSCYICYIIAKIIVDARICCLRVSRWVVGGAWSSVVLRDAFSSFRVAMLSWREVCREEHIVIGIVMRTTSLLRPLSTVPTMLTLLTSLKRPPLSLTPPPTHSLPGTHTTAHSQPPPPTHTTTHSPPPWQSPSADVVVPPSISCALTPPPVV